MLALYFAASALLALAPEPDDLVELPVFELGGAPSCDVDRDCPRNRPLCDTNTFQCVECLGPEHCMEGWTCGPTGTCLDACELDADCDGLQGQTKCDPETELCVQCLTTEDCTEEEYCDHQYCLQDHCTPDATFCFGSTIMLCLEDGGSTMEVETCPDACEDDDGTAVCVATPSSTGEPGGPTDGGQEGSTGGSATGASSAGGKPLGDGTSADEGCACRSTPASSAPWSLLLLGVFARRRLRAAASSGDRRP
jgi:MYXO-CTERM domain-containing protein